MWPSVWLSVSCVSLVFHSPGCCGGVSVAVLRASRVHLLGEGFLENPLIQSGQIVPKHQSILENRNEACARG